MEKRGRTRTDREVDLSGRREVAVCLEQIFRAKGGKTGRWSVVGRGAASYKQNQPSSLGAMEMGTTWTCLSIPRAWPLGGQMGKRGV